jgi:hypothetical protein
LNNVDGKLPLEIGQITELIELSIVNSDLSAGPVPESIGLCSMLRSLNFEDCKLQGEFPVGNFLSGICNLINLERLSIYETSVEGDIPECIGALSMLSYFDESNTNMGGLVPESIGKMMLLESLFLGYETKSNMFVGPLPSTMSKLVLLKTLYLKVPSLTGPLPDFSRLARLRDCAFTPSQLCSVEEFVPAGSICDFTVLPECEGPELPDCIILADWLPDMFGSSTCCQEDNVTCEDDQIVILDLSKTETKKHIVGIIPMTIGQLNALQELYLQDNLLEGNLPLSLSTISSLQIVDISNNFLSGVLPFTPSCVLKGRSTNRGL